MQNKSPVSLMTFVTQLQKVRKKLYKFGCCVPSCAKLVTEVYAYSDNDPTVLSVIGSIDTTSSAQPIVNVTRNVSAEYDVGYLLSDKYIFGFRDCTSNPSKVCYIMENVS